MGRRELLEALLDQPQYRALYQESTSFHAALDSIVAMLPTWIAGLATEALSDEARKIEALQHLMHDDMIKIRIDPADLSKLSGLTHDEVFEQDESEKEIRAVFERGEKGVTAQAVIDTTVIPKPMPEPVQESLPAAGQKPVPKRRAVKKTTKATKASRPARKRSR